MSEELPNPKRPKITENAQPEALHQFHTMSARLLVKKLSEHATIPVRASARAAGYDLFAAHDTSISAHGKALVKTDISLAIPTGHYGRIAPRSSLAWKNHIDVGAGVIDEDYRGPLGVVLFNHADEAFESTQALVPFEAHESMF
jgi:deoxyuridine 5'-triphosphate nucleotidohydrolase